MFSSFNSKLWVKFIAVFIIQSFLVFDITWAAGTRLSDAGQKAQSSTLAPRLAIGGGQFIPLLNQMLLQKFSTSQEIMLVGNLRNLSRVEEGIVAGRGLADVHGRVLKPDGRFFNADGKFAPQLQKFIDSLSDLSIQETIHAGIMYYDIRSKFWRENPEFTVAFALAFAKKLQEKTGKKDGIILNIGVDAYHKHFEVAQVFVDAILRTGICDNGGGINYWGVVNGGDIRNYSQLYDAVNGNGGHWVYFTMSHRPEDFLGAKMGINSKVYCGSEVRHCEGVTDNTLYDYIIKKDFAQIKHPAASDENVVTVANSLKNNIAVAADMIRATSAKADVAANKLLSGAKLYVDIGGSPIAKNLADMLIALGADVQVANSKLDQSFNTKNIIDPNEHRSAAVARARETAKKTGRVVLYVDPDGDRLGIAALDSKGEAISMTGSEVLLLAIENLAHSFKNAGRNAPTVICDMRTGVSAKDLAEALTKQGYPVNVVPHEAGYPFFMKGMSELPADIAVENTLHAFINPMTNANWGAPKNYSGYQGGDNAALFLLYIMGCMVNQWNGKNPVVQLESIRKTYGLKATFVDERKPALPADQDKYKYMIADKMKELAAAWFKGSKKFLINFNDPKVVVMSGVHITNAETGAMMLVRFSNTGSSFTISGEGYSREELNEMLSLGHLLITTAVAELKKEGHVFDFNEKDSADLKGVFKLSDHGFNAIPNTAEGFMAEIDYITRMLGAESNYPTVIEVWKRATDPVALINEYAKVSGKTVKEVLKVFDANDFLKTLSALYRLRTAGALKPSEYKTKSMEIFVSNDEYVSTPAQEDVKGQPLSDYLRLMREIASQVPNVFRDNMPGFVGAFLNIKTEGETETPDLKNIVERLKAFLATVDLTKISYIVTSGIGANEMYSHQLAASMNAFFQAKGLKVRWIVVNNPEHLGVIPEEANNENTIVFEMSRSGKTGETRDFFNATKDRFKTRIVAANGETLFKLAQDLKANGGNVLIIDDTPGHIGGRQMNRKTLMVYAPLFVALAGGLKDIAQAEEYLRAYTYSMLSANYSLNYGKGLKSYGVAGAEFLLRHRESGRSKFAVLYDDSLFPASKELGQLLNEGANKIIAGGANFNILDSYSLNKDRGLLDIVVKKAAKSQVFVALLNQNSPSFQEQGEYIQQLKKKGIPVLVILTDLQEADLKYNLAAIARLSALLQDITVYFTNITQQDANANPSVKLVREITAAMTALIKEKTAAGKTDLTLTADEVFSRIIQTQEKGRGKAKETLDKLGVKRGEFNPVFEQFKSAISGLVKTLGISESKATFVYMSAISDVVKADMSEPGKLHGSQEVEEAFSRTGLAGIVNTLAPAQQPVSLNKEVVVETTEKSRISVFADKETLDAVEKTSGDTAERIAQYLYMMWQTGRYDMKYMPLAYPEAERDNPVIAELRRFIVEKFGDLDVTSPQCPFPNAAHTGFESIVSHPLKVFYLALAYTDTYGKGMGTLEVEPGVTVDKAAYVYNLANDYRAPYGGSPSVILSVKNGKELENAKKILVKALELFRSKIDTQSTPAAETKNISNEKLIVQDFISRGGKVNFSSDLGATKLRMGVLTDKGVVGKELSKSLNRGSNPIESRENILNEFVNLFVENAKRFGLEEKNIATLWVSWAGPGNYEDGRVIGTNIEGFQKKDIGKDMVAKGGFPLAAELQKRFAERGYNVDVKIMHDGAAMAKGELFLQRGKFLPVTYSAGKVEQFVGEQGHFTVGIRQKDGTYSYEHRATKDGSFPEVDTAKGEFYVEHLLSGPFVAMRYVERVVERLGKEKAIEFLGIDMPIDDLFKAVELVYKDAQGKEDLLHPVHQVNNPKIVDDIDMSILPQKIKEKDSLTLEFVNQLADEYGRFLKAVREAYPQGYSIGMIVGGGIGAGFLKLSGQNQETEITLFAGFAENFLKPQAGEPDKFIEKIRVAAGLPADSNLIRRSENTNDTRLAAAFLPEATGAHPIELGVLSKDVAEKASQLKKKQKFFEKVKDLNAKEITFESNGKQYSIIPVKIDDEAKDLIEEYWGKIDSKTWEKMQKRGPLSLLVLNDKASKLQVPVAVFSAGNLYGENYVVNIIPFFKLEQGESNIYALTDYYAKEVSIPSQSLVYSVETIEGSTEVGARTSSRMGDYIEWALYEQHKSGEFSISRITPQKTTALGSPTVKQEVELSGGAKGSFVVPAGTSTGEDEAKTVGVDKAIENLAKIHGAVTEKGLKADQLEEIAAVMLAMGKDNLGAEATLSYQMAAAWAVAGQKGLQNYEFLRELAPDLASKGVPGTAIQYNITNGGEHAENSLDMQEFMIVTHGRTTAERNEMCDKIDKALGLIYQKLGLKADPNDKGTGKLRGKEGGYKIEDLTNDKLEEIYRNADKYVISNLDIQALSREKIGVHEFVLNCLLAAIKNAEYQPSNSKAIGTVSLALDVASTSMLVKGRNNLYNYEGRQISSEELIGIYSGWIKKYPIDSIEDGLGENDWDGWIKMIKAIGSDVLLIGDDNLVTQGGRLSKFIALLKENGLINAQGKVTKKLGILIKLNQNGFLTTGINNPNEGYLGTLEVIRLAKQYGIEWIVSHRSKEAEPQDNEVSIAELAAATNAYALKSGDHVQAIRAVKEDRLAAIDARERNKNVTVQSSQDSALAMAYVEFLAEKLKDNKLVIQFLGYPRNSQGKMVSIVGLVEALQNNDNVLTNAVLQQLDKKLNAQDKLTMEFSRQVLQRALSPEEKDLSQDKEAQQMVLQAI